MATVRTLITRAFLRMGEIAADESPTAEDASYALDALNDMLAEWNVDAVNMRCPTFALADTFYAFIPPADLEASILEDLTDNGNWNASTNSPSLSSGTSTNVGDLYKVSVAGSTELDDIASWSVNDFLVFDGDVWLKSQSSRNHEGAIAANLAVRLCPDFGREPSQSLFMQADRGYRGILSRFVLPRDAEFDAALINLPSRRFYGYMT